MQTNVKKQILTPRFLNISMSALMLVLLIVNSALLALGVTSEVPPSAKVAIIAVVAIYVGAFAVKIFKYAAKVRKMSKNGQGRSAIVSTYRRMRIIWVLVLIELAPIYLIITLVSTPSAHYGMNQLAIGITGYAILIFHLWNNKPATPKKQP